MSSGAGPERAATLGAFARLFLEETARADRSFALSRARVGSALAGAEGRRVALALAEDATQVDALHDALRQEVDRAARLAISEVTVTFWVEPVRPGWFARLLGFLRLRPPPREDLVRLASAERNPRAARFELRIARAPSGRLEAGEAEPY